MAVEITRSKAVCLRIQFKIQFNYVEADAGYSASTSGSSIWTGSWNRTASHTTNGYSLNYQHRFLGVQFFGSNIEVFLFPHFLRCSQLLKFIFEFVAKRWLLQIVEIGRL